MRLDSHQHFWSYDEQQYPWIPKGSPLHRDWLPEDLEGEQAKVEMRGSVAVQARQTIEESRWLMELAERHPQIRAVVGWVDLCADDVEGQLATFAPHQKFAGVRHVVQDEPDEQFMLREAFLRGIAKLRQFALTYDILIYPKQLPAAIELAARFPEQPFVLDHIAKPHIRDGTLSPWREQVHELAQARNVFCKVSGMITEASHHEWKPDDFRPYLDEVFEAFPVDRLMWGSDWPVCLLAGSYEQVFQLVDTYTAHLASPQREALFGGTAARFYGIPS